MKSIIHETSEKKDRQEVKRNWSFVREAKAKSKAKGNALNSMKK